jgi:hypothetical protein
VLLVNGRPLRANAASEVPTKRVNDFDRSRGDSAGFVSEATLGTAKTSPGSDMSEPPDAPGSRFAGILNEYQESSRSRFPGDTMGLLKRPAASVL